MGRIDTAVLWEVVISSSLFFLIFPHLSTACWLLPVAVFGGHDDDVDDEKDDDDDDGDEDEDDDDSVCNAVLEYVMCAEEANSGGCLLSSSSLSLSS